MACESGVPKLFHGMSFLMGFGYTGTGLSPQQLAELLTYAGGRVLDQLSNDLGEHTKKFLCLHHASQHQCTVDYVELQQEQPEIHQVSL